MIIKKLFYIFFLSCLSLFCVIPGIYVCYGDEPNFYHGRKAKRVNRLFLEVEDGDTVIYRGIVYRFLGVDTPEVRNPEIGIFTNQKYGIKAREFTRKEILSAGVISYIEDGRDIYGRVLAHFFVDGYPLSLKIVEEGLGYETVSFYGNNGFPEIADRILNASRLHPDLPFENPYLWRRTHQKKIDKN